MQGYSAEQGPWKGEEPGSRAGELRGIPFAVVCIFDVGF